MLTLDTVTSGPPPVPDPSRELEPWRDAEGVVCARLFRGDDGYLIQWGDTSLFEFHPGRRTVRAWPRPASAAPVVADHFARRIQPLLLQATGHLVLHASAASAGRQVMAFTGRSGTGKSTLASTLQNCGCTQWADDAVVVDVSGQPPEVIALPFSAASRPSRHGVVPGARAPLGAIVLVARESGAPEAGGIEPVNDASALTHVLAHAHVFEPGASLRLIDQYATLLASVPVFRLVFDHGPGGPGLLARTMASWMRAREHDL